MSSPIDENDLSALETAPTKRRRSVLPKRAWPLSRKKGK